MKQSSERLSKSFKWLIVLIFGLVTFLISWSSDDAFHAYIMAKNLAEGNGLVYNVGYRVTASTCPLFTLITAFAYFISGCRNIYFIGTALGVIFSTLAVYILVFKLELNNVISFLSVCILMGNYCFMCHTTSGLENSLLYFLSAVFIMILTKTDKYSNSRLLLLVLTLSLIAMTRMDSVLIFIPAICVVWLFYSEAKLLKRVLIGICGLLPFVLWEMFSIIYYGFPFPNTMYVKLNTGFRLSEYISRGLEYIYCSSIIDLTLILVPIVFLIMSAAWKNTKMTMMAVGCFLYLLYVIYIGGDFIVGRHMTVTFFVSLIGLIILVRERIKAGYADTDIQKVLLALAACEIITIIVVRPVTNNSIFNVTINGSTTGVANEKYYYYKYTGLFPVVASKMNGRDSLKDLAKFQKADEIENNILINNYSGSIEPFVGGVANYYIQENNTFYLTDDYGLMDPLLSHLPAVWEDNWRIGHMKRKVPEGYAESVATGTNQIVDESLHEYYDKVLLIVTGNIWDSERLRTIVNMNLGKYDYLIDEYISRDSDL